MPLTEAEELELLELEAEEAQAMAKKTEAPQEQPPVLNTAVNSAIGQVKNVLPQVSDNPLQTALNTSPLPTQEKANIGLGAANALTFGGAEKGLRALSPTLPKPTQTQKAIGGSVGAMVPIEGAFIGAAKVVGNIAKDFKMLSGGNKLALQDNAWKALNDAKNVMYERYGDLVEQGLQKNGDKVIPIDDIVAHVGREWDNLLPNVQNVLKRHGIKDMIGAEGATLNAKSADTIIKALRSAKGQNNYAVRDIGRKLYDAAADVIPELKQAKSEYKEFRDAFKLASREVGEQGTSLIKNIEKGYSNIAKQRAVQNTLGLSKPNVIKDIEAFRSASKNIGRLKAVSGITAADYVRRKIFGGRK